MANEFVARKGIISNGDIALKNRITIGGSSGVATSGAGFWTDYIAGGKTSLGALTAGNGYGIFYYQGGAGRDGNDSIDFAFNTTTAATSVMSVKTNGEVKISGSVTATGFLGNATSATDSTKWNTMTYLGTLQAASPTYVMTYDGTQWRPSNAVSIKEFLSGQTINAHILGNAATATITSSSFAGTAEGNLVYAQMADNDQFRIRVGGTISNAGWVEIATADDGNEPIYVRQYTGVFTTVARTATLLDGSGNTSFPGGVTATAFYSTSDIRLKNLVSINNKAELINSITYTWKDKSKGNLVQTGYSAQDVQKYMPDAVNEDEEGTLSVNYIQVLVAKVDALERKIKLLENAN